MARLTKEQKAIKRLKKPSWRVLQALRTHHGTMGRSEAWGVAGRALLASQIDLMLQTHLAGLVVQTEVPVREDRSWGRTQKEWRLTESGWLYSGGFPNELSPPSQLVNAHVVARLLNRLAEAGDKWALDVQAARQAWANRTRVDAMPTIESVKDDLWRMIDGPKRDFAMHWLSQMDLERFKEWERVQKLRAKEAKARRRRPFDEKAIARINAARARLGQGPMEFKGRDVRGLKSDPKPRSAATVEPKLTPEPPPPPVLEEKPEKPRKMVCYKDQLDHYWLRVDGVGRMVNPKPEHFPRLQVVEVKWYPITGTKIELRSGIGWDLTKSNLPATIKPEYQEGLDSFQ